MSKKDKKVEKKDAIKHKKYVKSDASSKKVVKESLQKFVELMMAKKPETAKDLLKSVVEQKIKQKIININNA